MKTIEVKYIGGKPEVIWQRHIFKKNVPIKIKMKEDWVLPFNIVETGKAKEIKGKEVKEDGNSSTARVPVGKKRTNKLQ